MTDGLINLEPVWTAVTMLFSVLWVPLLIIIGVYLGLFVIGLIFEGFQRRDGAHVD